MNLALRPLAFHDVTIMVPVLALRTLKRNITHRLPVLLP